METAIQDREHAMKVQEAKAAVEKLRQKIAEFHTARLQTSELRAGMRQAKDPRTGEVLPPDEVTRRIRRGRDAAVEERAIAELRDFLRLILNREPSVEDMQNTVPQADALGFVWLPLIALSTVIGGAVSLEGIFGYLTERERRVQYELGYQPRQTGAEVFASTMRWLVPALAIIGLGVGGYYVYRDAKKLKKNPDDKKASQEVVKNAPPDWEDAEED